MSATVQPRNDPRVIALATLVRLEQSLSDGDGLQHLLFILANDTSQLVRYQQAAIWSRRGDKVVALSGLAEIDQRAPFISWLAHVLRHLDKTQSAISAVTRDSLPNDL